MSRRLSLLLAAYLCVLVVSPLWHAAAVGLGRLQPWAASLPLPNLAVLATLYLALGVRGSPSSSAASVALLGYLMDLLTGAPKGMHVLSLLVVYFLVRASSRRLYVQGRLTQMGIALVATLLHATIGVALHVALPPRGEWSILAHAPVEAGITAAVAPLGFYLLWRLDRRVTRNMASEGVFR